MARIVQEQMLRKLKQLPLSYSTPDDCYNCSPNHAVVRCLAQGNFCSLEWLTPILERPFTASEWLELGVALYGKLPNLKEVQIEWLIDEENGTTEENAEMNKDLLLLLRGGPLRVCWLWIELWAL